MKRRHRMCSIRLTRPAVAGSQTRSAISTFPLRHLLAEGLSDRQLAWLIGGRFFEFEIHLAQLYLAQMFTPILADGAERFPTVSPTSRSLMNQV